MYVEVVLDHARRLRFDVQAIQLLENLMGGRPLGRVVDDLQAGGFNALVMSLLAGFSHEDPALTSKFVSHLVANYVREGGTLDTLFNAVKRALEDSGLFKTAEERLMEKKAAETKALEGNGQPERPVM